MPKYLITMSYQAVVEAENEELAEELMFNELELVEPPDEITTEVVPEIRRNYGEEKTD